MLRQAVLGIDADHIPYKLCWRVKDIISEAVLVSEIKKYLRGLVIQTGCQSYLGVLGNRNAIRQSRYKLKPYKGNRSTEKEPWLADWEPFVKEHLKMEWGFLEAKSVEADDVLGLMSKCCPPDLEFIIASPDKDLKQLPGRHYNLHIKGNTMSEVTPFEGAYNLQYQMLVGDDVDNIAGLPGWGPKKAEILLKPFGPGDEIEMERAVFEEYRKYFLDHYGEEIYYDTLYALTACPDIAHAVNSLHEQGATDLRSFIHRFELDDEFDTQFDADTNHFGIR